MNIKDIKKTIPIILLLVLAEIGFGQITYENVITSDGFMGMGAFKSTAKTYLNHDAQRAETDLKFTGKLMKHFSPKGTTVSIIRLDKEVVWNIDNAKKTYTEQTFADIKKMLEEGMAESDQQMPPQEQDYESEYNWDKPQVKVENLNEYKTINGFDCQHYLASITTIGTHKETGEKDTMLFVTELWNAKNITANMNLVYDFSKRYTNAIGFDAPENQGIALITGMYKDQMQILENEARKIDGYPIVNDMKLTITKNAKIEEKKPEEENVSLRDIQRDFSGLVGKKIIKDAANKKKMDDKPSVVELFHMRSEVLSIENGEIAGDKFEIPKGFKLKK